MASRAAAAPVLDGNLDDPAWQTAQSIDKFLEYEPNQGVETRFRTNVRGEDLLLAQPMKTTRVVSFQF